MDIDIQINEIIEMIELLDEINPILESCDSELVTLIRIIKMLRFRIKQIVFKLYRFIGSYLNVKSIINIIFHVYNIIYLFYNKNRYLVYRSRIQRTTLQVTYITL